ncbi:MarR family winged helix-turn-helix transcriptional regulator [Streptomyces tropicalis]|uniref:MarR family transcriptional regulator n=1 Tax=Streptomyces tropicalis TaxID=3034234 RepID=A0ABT6A3I6_9ACTN|nr:MarR family transcriptional regulator [Streptomyces tropicalis]MDF3299206.1 MarR family transcriptional regulator [Streptomyces tropicalis]
MTHQGDSGDDPALRPEDGAEAVALDIAEAVGGMAGLWTMAAQEASLRPSFQQLRALRALAADPGLNLTTLADRLDTGPPTASRLCDRLEAAGLLERAAHPHNRREVRLGLTAQGRRVLAEVAGIRARALADVLRTMDPADRAALQQGMRAFRAGQEAAPPRR